jgi:predicted membrane protein
MTTNTDNPMTSPRFVLGAGIALFGLVLMFDRLHLVDASYVLRFWPLVIVAIGVQRFFNPRPGRSNTQGIVWMAIGGWLLLNTLGAFRVAIWDMFWPVVLIWFGAHLMQRTSVNAWSRGRDGWTGGGDAGAADANDQLYLVAIMSGVKRSSNSAHFKGGEMTAFMGGGQVDLRQAVIPPGEEASIEILAVMGGFELIIPNNWVVVTPLLPIMGGIDDKRLAPPPGTVEVGGQAAPRLALRGFVMMGGVTLRS